MLIFEKDCKDCKRQGWCPHVVEKNVMTQQIRELLYQTTVVKVESLQCLMFEPKENEED